MNLREKRSGRRRRGLAWLLSAAITVGLLPVGALAAEHESGHNHGEAGYVLETNDLGNEQWYYYTGQSRFVANPEATTPDSGQGITNGGLSSPNQPLPDRKSVV